MKSAELLRKLKKLSKQREVEFRMSAAKGSHQKLHFGERTTIIPLHGTELKTGTLKAILKDLGISEDEL